MIGAECHRSARSASVPDLPRFLEFALEDRWHRYQKAFDRCRKKFSEDPVHQLRVETRRLLALIDLLGTWAAGDELQALRRVLKKFLRSFSRLRDTQVQLMFVDKHRRRFPEIGRFAKSLGRLEQRLIGKLDKEVRRVGWRKMKALVVALEKVLDAALVGAGLRVRGGELLLTHVRRTFQRVLTLRRRIHPERPLTIHRTRVAFKRFRYLLELLEPLLPGVTLRQLQSMHDYQTLMGEIQDLEVLQGALDRFVEEKPDSAEPMERFHREIEREHTARIQRYLKQADQLLSFWPVPAALKIRRRPRAAHPLEQADVQVSGGGVSVSRPMGLTISTEQ
jgi:CHAD domain-containing protein